MFSNLEHRTHHLKKSISIDISFDSNFLLNFHISASYVMLLLTTGIELYISNLFFLVICIFHNIPFSIVVIVLPLLILFLVLFSSTVLINSYSQILNFFASSNGTFFIPTKLNKCVQNFRLLTPHYSILDINCAWNVVRPGS